MYLSNGGGYSYQNECDVIRRLSLKIHTPFREHGEAETQYLPWLLESSFRKMASMMVKANRLDPP